mmetsp:Transcript_23941/g.40979  ORF Transcript_23941/g.40979 Transcript_23941/m.40979 type:complete len:99 (+) Transcript_23941:533-829(+)
MHPSTGQIRAFHPKSFIRPRVLQFATKADLNNIFQSRVGEVAAVIDAVVNHAVHGTPNRCTYKDFQSSLHLAILVQSRQMGLTTSLTSKYENAHLNTS